MFKLKFFINLKFILKNFHTIFKNKYKIEKKLIFKHGYIQYFSKSLIIIPSYHPSPRNVNTKLLSEKMMINLFIKAKTLAKI